MVLGVCFKYLKDKEKAEDKTCDIFLSLFEKLKNHQIESFKPWLYTNTKNECLMQLRKRRTYLKQLNGAEKDCGISALELKLLHENKLELLELKLGELKKSQADCLEHFYLKEQSYAEVAANLDMEVKKVKSHIQNGKRKLKLLLSQYDEFNENG
ncbi:MAG: sigma-70 family RNA polymerase sigma factor [Flavobacteriales bacterium]|nr:sigma-70 family RNA polymerase sigma factor [Flavobacteriales bacterium]